MQDTAQHFSHASLVVPSHLLPSHLVPLLRTSTGETGEEAEVEEEAEVCGGGGAEVCGGEESEVEGERWRLVVLVGRVAMQV